jgi:hypothetical protein
MTSWKNLVVAIIRLVNVQIERLKVERDGRDALRAIVRELQQLNVHYATLLAPLQGPNKEQGKSTAGGQR